MAAEEPPAARPIPAKVPGCYRVLHSADWHLGKMLNDQSRAEEHARFLAWILQTIRDFEVDVLVLAGDIFDSANPPQAALTMYYDFVAKLYHEGVCILVVVAGNHDSPAQLEAPRQVLQALNTHVVGALPDSPESRLVVLPSPDEPRLVVAAIPYLRESELRRGQPGQGAEEIQRQLLAGITQRYAETAESAAPWAERGVPILATGHLTVIGSSASESEREIHVGGLGAVGPEVFPAAFSYMALGHLHRPQAASGNECIRYSGSPIPLSFSEATDKKEVRLLDFDAGGLQGQWPLPVPVFRRLAQIRTNRIDLEQTLRDFDPGTGELPTWVEVVVADAGPGENLNEVVQEQVKDQEFQVLKVLRAGATVLQGMSAEDHSDDEVFETLLDDPKQVFRHRLDEEPGLAEEERAALEMVFSQLLETHQAAVKGE